MPQGVVRDDGSLIKAQALISVFGPPAFGGRGALFLLSRVGNTLGSPDLPMTRRFHRG